MCVHAHHRDFNRATEVEVVVAQVVGGRLKLLLVHLRCIVNCSVEDWLCSGDSCLVWDKIEVKQIISLVLDKGCIHDSAWTRVKAVTIILMEQSMLNVPINKAVHNLGFVALSFGLK